MLYKNGTLLFSLLKVKILTSAVSLSQGCHKNKKSEKWVDVKTLLFTCKTFYKLKSYYEFIKCLSDRNLDEFTNLVWVQGPKVIFFIFTDVSVILMKVLSQTSVKYYWSFYFSSFLIYWRPTPFNHITYKLC